jgi:cytoplasmic iron level regulating protein YaaA (DUF328/UPF0246 family)
MREGGESRYLLIVGCSQRKRKDRGLLPAIERYDGVNYRVLRKAMRDGYWPENLDILIISAKHGVLHAQTPIDNYDVLMTERRALALREAVARDLDRVLAESHYEKILVNVGAAYLVALDASAELSLRAANVHFVAGRIG